MALDNSPGMKIGKIALGFATGGPVGGAMALLGAGGGQSNSMVNRLNSNATDFSKMGPDEHNKIFDDGIQAIHDSDLPPEVGHHLMSSILAAKHYGMNGLEAPDTVPYNPSAYGINPDQG